MQMMYQQVETPIKQQKVFGRNPTSPGNLMAVVSQPSNPLESGIPVTVLIEPSSIADVKFRFFYPNSLEASICGHALLGAAQTIERAHFTVETGAGVREVRKLGQQVLVNFGGVEEIQPNFTTPPPSTLFGIDPNQMTTRGIFSAGKPKLMVEVDTQATLSAVQFDLDALLAWNRDKNFSGYTLFTQRNNQIYARATNPLYNIPEDAACAVCCAALPIPVTRNKRITVQMGYPEYANEIFVETIDEQRWVGGNVFESNANA